MPKIYSVTSDDGNTNSDQEPIVDKKVNIPPPPSFLQNLTPNVVRLNEDNENDIESYNVVDLSQMTNPNPDKTDDSHILEERPLETTETVESTQKKYENNNGNQNNSNISKYDENQEEQQPPPENIIPIEFAQNNDDNNQNNIQEPPPPPVNSAENQSLDSSDEIPMANNYNNDDYSNTELLFELYTTKIKSLLQKKFIVLNTIDSRVKELEKRELEMTQINELKEKVELQQNMILKLTEELQTEKEERMKLENKFEELKQSIMLISNNEIQQPQQQQQQQPQQPQQLKQQLYPSANNNNNNSFYSALNTHWVKYYDDGVPYYYNVVNNKSMWEVPSEGFMEEWTYNSLYEEYNNNNNKQYYTQQQQQQYQSEEEINSIFLLLLLF